MFYIFSSDLVVDFYVGESSLPCYSLSAVAWERCRFEMCPYIPLAGPGQWSVSTTWSRIFFGERSFRSLFKVW